MSPSTVWKSLGDGDQRAAVEDRIPRLGYVFRCVISGKTKERYIEFQDDFDKDKWHTVGVAPKSWKLKKIDEPEQHLAG